MTKKAKYAIMRLQPYQGRSEHVNIGIVVWSDDMNEPRLYLLNNLKKVVAFYPRANLETLRSWERDLAEHLHSFGSHDFESQHRALQSFGTLLASDKLGSFCFDSVEAYHNQVAQALALVAEPAMRRNQIREPISRLFVDLKLQFSFHGWMGKQASDINKNLIVPRYTLPTDEQLVAEFAIKNDVLHVVETLDLRTGISSSKKMEAQGKAFLMSIAKSIEDKDIPKSSTYMVVAGAYGDSKSKQITSIINRHSDIVIEWEDKQSIESFMALMAKATNTPMLNISVN
jgi:hypothetical protein